jgi:hypothetical protein
MCFDIRRAVRVIALKGLTSIAGPYLRVLSITLLFLSLEFCAVLLVPAYTNLALVFLNQDLNVECTINGFISSWLARRLFEGRGFTRVDVVQVTVKLQFLLNTIQESFRGCI